MNSNITKPLLFNSRLDELYKKFESFKLELTSLASLKIKY